MPKYFVFLTRLNWYVSSASATDCIRHLHRALSLSLFLPLSVMSSQYGECVQFECWDASFACITFMVDTRSRKLNSSPKKTERRRSWRRRSETPKAFKKILNGFSKKKPKRAKTSHTATDSHLRYLIISSHMCSIIIILMCVRHRHTTDDERSQKCFSLLAQIMNFRITSYSMASLHNEHGAPSNDRSTKVKTKFICVYNLHIFEFVHVKHTRKWISSRINRWNRRLICCRYMRIVNDWWWYVVSSQNSIFHEISFVAVAPLERSMKRA